MPSNNTIVNVTITNTPNGVKTEIVTSLTSTAAAANRLHGSGAATSGATGDVVGIVPLKLEMPDTETATTTTAEMSAAGNQSMFMDDVTLGTTDGLSIG